MPGVEELLTRAVHQQAHTRRRRDRAYTGMLSWSYCRVVVCPKGHIAYEDTVRDYWCWGCHDWHLKEDRS